MILVTGGTGFIGSHTCVELFEAGYNFVIADNLQNSDLSVLDSIEAINKIRPKFVQADVSDKAALDRIFTEYKISGIIHFAGYKAVGESVSNPLKYYRNNINTTISLCEAMTKYSVKNIVFSSSATVYGENNPVPYTEDMPASDTKSPYGRTKIFCENILRDFQQANPEINVTILRYFNPIGAHPSGLIGEDPSGIPDNLFPYILRVAAGKLDVLNVFGNDYDTPDGTGIRDYIHICDLSRAHILALKQLEQKGGFNIYNIGTGKGTSVLELVEAMSRTLKRELPYVIAPRRAGDMAISCACVDKAREQLGFIAKYDILKMCEDGWNYAQKHFKV